MVQTFRINKPIIMIPNYFANNSEYLSDKSIINEEDQIILKCKMEGLFGIDPLQRHKKIDVSETLKRKVRVYQNMLIHRSEHLCRTKKQTSEEILAQDTSNNTDEINESITNKSNMAQSFLSNVVSGVDGNNATNMITNIEKNFTPSDLSISGLEEDIKVGSKNSFDKTEK